jgi:hypothetical protein
MQYISRHSSNARRTGGQPLLQPLPTFGGQRAAFAAAGLPSLSSEVFAMPQLPRLPRTAATHRPTRRVVSQPISSTRVALSLGAGSTFGLLLGGLLCSLFS